MVFFFKQKTAYEMRISDWSSDVCSSDLRPPRRSAGPRRRPGRGLRPSPRRPCPRDVPCVRASLGPTGSYTHTTRENRVAAPAGFRKDGAERKSVVAGKSVSVRVDLGGRRIIKKTTRDNSTMSQET